MPNVSAWWSWLLRAVAAGVAAIWCGAAANVSRLCLIVFVLGVVIALWARRNPLVAGLAGAAACGAAGVFFMRARQLSPGSLVKGLRLCWSEALGNLNVSATGAV